MVPEGSLDWRLSAYGLFMEMYVLKSQLHQNELLF